MTKCQKSLTKKFSSTSVNSLHDVYEEFRNSSAELESEIETVLKVSDPGIKRQLNNKRSGF